MTIQRLIAALILAVFYTMSGGAALAQTKSAPAKNRLATRAGDEGGSRKEMLSESKLTAEQEKLVRGSKEAILATGLSEPYFNEHFRLVQVVNKQGNRQVVWKFSLGDYETTLNDIVGYYAAEGGRTDTHSITGALGSTYEIRKTIPKLRAEKIMRECIGRYTGGVVVYQNLSGDGQTSLYLIAEAADNARRDAEWEERERLERERVEREERVRQETQKSSEGGATSGEPVKVRNKKVAPPPFFIGYVNLETGKCIKAQGIRGQGIPSR